VQRRLPQLDGVRGLAILVVMLHNERSFYPSLHLQTIFENGWMGVDLFFALSGFLITGILLDSKESGNYFRNFYARRCLRIWPLYYCLIGFMFVILPAIHRSAASMVFERSSPWWAYPFFLQNLLVAVPTSAAGLLGVTWSLAVEEQFYLVWPLAVRALSKDQLRRLAVIVICISPALRLLLLSHHADLYSNTFSRLDGLMSGSLIAVLARSSDFEPTRFIKPAWILLFTALPLAFVLEALKARWIVYSFSTVASASFVFLSLYSGQPWLQAGLRNRFMVYTGQISYGLYLMHKLPFDSAKEYQFNAHPVLMMFTLLAACYGMAALSWSLLEMPFLKLKKFFESRPVPAVEIAPLRAAKSMHSA
jgi:peptidoglycan/LPS O-acetylase OafA/YrhL